MIIEIHGAGFNNKGAEMMLRTTIAELSHRLPAARLAIDPSYGSYSKRAQLGLYQLFPLRTHVGTPAFNFRLWRQKVVSSIFIDSVFKRIFGLFPFSLGLVTLSKIDAFVDISGFAYSDQWGPEPIRDLANLVKQYAGHKKPVILLPQAYGPFLDAESRNAFCYVLDNATLVYARDRKSFAYANELSSRNNLFIAPDITFFYPDGNPPRTPKTSSEFVCVIPNIRMLDQGVDDWGQKYVKLLIRGISEIVKYGYEVQILVHDSTGQDEQIAIEIQEKIKNNSITMIDEKNPLKLKKIIGKSKFILSSRYHSLIAAFSKAVPAIGLGWSHKYELLFDDFNCNDLFISSQSSTDEFLEAIRRLSDPEVNTRYRSLIIQNLQEFQTSNRNMWDNVAAVLSKHQNQNE